MKTAIVFLADGFEECESLGAGIPFSLKLVEILIDKEMSEKVRTSICTQG